MNEADLSYIAGFFDGEGCCGIKQIKRPHAIHHCAYVTVSQVRPEVLYWMQSHFGGSIMWKKPRRNSGIWAWQLSNKKALAFLSAVIPYLKIKKSEAELVVSAFTVRVRNKRAGVPTDIQEAREAARQKVMQLRKLG